jgi:hypothetical protein
MKNQWQHYKELELLPASAPQPRATHPIASPLSWSWRLLINALVREHLYEQRTEYLDRCWLLDYENPYASEKTAQFQKLMELMN